MKKTHSKRSTILCIGASDSSGFTGIQMDIKTAQILRCQATTAVTCLYARNSKGARDRHILPAEFIKKQIDVILSDEQVQAVKVGDLVNEDIMNMVGDVMNELTDKKIPIVLDSVMGTHCQTYKTTAEDRAAFKRRLALQATVMIASREEAELLTGMQINDIDDLTHAASILRTLGPSAVVVRGGTLGEGKNIDIVATEDEETMFEAIVPPERYGARGVGASISTATAAGLSKGNDLKKSLLDARKYLSEALDSVKNFPDGCAAVDPVDLMQRLYESGI